MVRMRWPSCLLLFLAAMIFDGSSCAGRRQEGKTTVSEPSIDALFSATLATRGAAYVHARDAVLALGSSAVPALQAKRSSPDWKEGFQATILSGWLVDTALFRECTDFVAGKLPGRPGITGEFGPMERAQAITGLGPKATPCILELLMKVRSLDGKQRAAIVGALRIMADRSAVDPLLSLLADDDEQLRGSAAGILGAFKEPRTIAPLVAVLKDPKQPEQVRVGAAGSLGQLDARMAAPVLREIVADESLSPRLRGQAANALAVLKDRQAIPVLVATGRSARDRTFLLELVAALGKIGDPSALPALHEFKKQPDQFVRERAEDAEREIVPPP